MPNVHCKNCGTEFPIDHAPVDREIPCRLCRAPVAVPAVPTANLTTCAHCGQQVPVYDQRCSGCGRAIESRLAIEDEATQLAQLLDGLDALAAAPGALEQVDAARGRRTSAGTIGLALFGTLCPGWLFLLVLTTDGDATGKTIMTVFGGILGLILGGVALGSWLKDRAAWNIAGSDTPQRALQRWLTALRTKREAKAWACVAPSGRSHGRLEPLAFKKVRPMAQRFAPGGFDDFRRYWQAVLRGEAGETRYAGVKKVQVGSRTKDGFALLTAEVSITSYPTLIILLILINLLVLALVYLVVRKQETVTIRKLLVYRHGRWWVAEPGWEGALDRARLG